MGRLLAGLLAVVTAALVALAAIWLLGQLLQFLGVFLAGLAGVLAGLLWFLVLAVLLGGLAYFLASVYRRPGA
ncbi:hypothetical protein [Deinococcus pimensis]|uniref:hypothetical protein n=1 Tax=Deinococcus pimensis TaxID=309888 RepID=UPI000484B705|nr:hypothetical protein [Deinococcus pimensis]